VASIIEASSEEAAIEIANDTRYGLSSAIFSSNVGHALELAKRINSGMCHINGATVHDEPQMPFGGVGDSASGGSARVRRWRNSLSSAGSRFRTASGTTPFDGPLVPTR